MKLLVGNPILVLAAIMSLGSVSFATCKTDSKLNEKGAAVYKSACLMCHGSKGDVTGPEAVAGASLKARNLVSDPFKNKNGGATLEGVLNVIEKGLPGTAMAPFGHIPEADRCALANYVMSLRKTK